MTFKPDIPAILDVDPEGGVFLRRAAAMFIYPARWVRSRKPRTNPTKQSHDAQEWNHPIAVSKHGKRRAAGLCVGCGKKPCKCRTRSK